MLRNFIFYSSIAIAFSCSGMALAERLLSQMPVKQVSIKANKPLVIGFFPPLSREEINSGDGTAEALHHLQFALEDISKCMNDKKITRLEFTRRIILHTKDHTHKINILPDWNRGALGAVLIQPGKKPRVEYATGGASFLIHSLPQAAGEYFNDPKCKSEKKTADEEHER